MCDECIRLFDTMDAATYAAIETLRPILTRVFASVNAAANADIEDEELDPDIAGLLFAPFVAGYLAGEFATCEEQGESMMDLFESGLAYGILRRQAAESRKVH